MFRRISMGLFLGLVLGTALSLISVPARAANDSGKENWAIAQRSPKQIVSFVDRVLKAEKDVPGGESASVVVLYNQVMADIDISSTKLCRNLILLVQDPSKLPERALHPYTTAESEITAMGAFRYRDGKLYQLAGRQLDSTPPDPPRRGQARFSWPDIQTGDVIGWSVVSSYPDPIYARVLPAVTQVPVVRSNLRVVTTGYDAYKIVGRNGDDHDYKLVVSRKTNGLPSDLSASMNYLPGYPELPLSPPYGADVPVFEVVHVGRYTTLPGVGRGWIPTTGWRRVARHFAMIEEEAGVASTEVDSLAHALTDGVETDVEKEAAIFDFVQNKVESARGPQYDRFSQRKASLVAKSMLASDMEKILLMESLLQAVQLDGRIAGVRREAYGPLEDDLPGYQNFTDFAVRCGEDSPRWYVPYAPDAAPRQMPPSWGRCTVLSPVAGVMQKAFEFNMKVQDKMGEALEEDSMALANTDALIEKVDAAADKETWYRLETVGGN